MYEFNLIGLNLMNQYFLTMKKLLLFLFLLFCCVEIQAQSDELWKKVPSSGLSTSKRNDLSDQGKSYYQLNETFLKNKLSGTLTQTAKKATVEITIPNSDGILERFSV